MAMRAGGIFGTKRHFNENTHFLSWEHIRKWHLQRPAILFWPRCINSLGPSDAYMCRWVIIGCDNDLSPVRHQAIIWTIAGILLIGPLGTKFSEILIGIQTFSFKKFHLKTSSAKWRLFCLYPCCWIPCEINWPQTAMFSSLSYMIDECLPFDKRKHANVKISS